MATESTFRTMTREHLGSDATDLDLTAFVVACEAYQRESGASDQEATDYIWNDGDCWGRVSRWAPSEASAADAGENPMADDQRERQQAHAEFLDRQRERFR